MSSFSDRFRAAFSAALQGRYGRSILGRAWMVIAPGCLVATLVFALHWLVGPSRQLSVLSLVLGLVLWNFFAGATAEGIGGIPARRALLQSGPDAALVLVAATVLLHLFEMLVSLLVFVGCQRLLGSHPGPAAWAAVLPIAALVPFTVGAACLLVVLRARLGDADHLWKLILSVGFWITPVVYEVSIVPERYRPWVEANPLARIVGDARSAMLHAVPLEPGHMIVTGVVSITVFFFGRWLIVRSAALIAERS